MIVFGEKLCENVLKAVPHRHWVFSIPKRLKIYFLYDRNLLKKLSLCVWKVLSAYLKHTVPYEDAEPGVVAAMQSFGDFLEFHPHFHVISSDGCFYGEGSFMVSPAPNARDLENAFRQKYLSSQETPARQVLSHNYPTPVNSKKKAGYLEHFKIAGFIKD